MIICYLRSSSISTWNLCTHKYWLNYVLGIRHPSGKSAAVGNVTHKALELLALGKLATQNGKNTFKEEEFNSELPSDLDPEVAIKISFDYYSELENHLVWENKDFNAARKYMWNHLNFRDGIYDPRKRKIIAVEKFFDITINEPWSHYKYTLPNNEIVEGNLSVKGTIDLITEADDESLEIIDIKTGKVDTFPDGNKRTLDYVYNDFQFLLYQWVCRQLFPQYKYVSLSVFYSQFNIPFTTFYDNKDIDKTTDLIRNYFKEIKDNMQPTLNRGWWCKVCHYDKAKHENSQKSICEHYKNEIQYKKMDEIFIDRDAIKLIREYGSGGGRNK